MKTGIQETDRLINKIVRLVVETGALNGESHVFDPDTYIMKQCVSECHSSHSNNIFRLAGMYYGPPCVVTARLIMCGPGCAILLSTVSAVAIMYPHGVSFRLYTRRLEQSVLSCRFVRVMVSALTYTD